MIDIEEIYNIKNKEKWKNIVGAKWKYNEDLNFKLDNIYSDYKIIKEKNSFKRYKVSEDYNLIYNGFENSELYSNRIDRFDEDSNYLFSYFWKSYRDLKIYYALDKNKEISPMMIASRSFITLNNFKNYLKVNKKQSFLLKEVLEQNKVLINNTENLWKGISIKKNKVGFYIPTIILRKLYKESENADAGFFWWNSFDDNYESTI